MEYHQEQLVAFSCKRRGFLRTMPDVIEKHVTFTRQLDSASNFNFALMIAPDLSYSGKNSFDPAQTVELEMHQ